MTTESAEALDNEPVQPDENPVAAEVMAAAPVVDISASPYQGAHWTKIKAMVEAAGGEYEDKTQALTFLETRRLAAADEPAEAPAADEPAEAPAATTVPEVPPPNGPAETEDTPASDQTLDGMTLDDVVALLAARGLVVSKAAVPAQAAEDADGFPRFEVLEPYVQRVSNTGSIYVQNGHKYIEGGKCIGPDDE